MEEEVQNNDETCKKLNKEIKEINHFDNETWFSKLLINANIEFDDSCGLANDICEYVDYNYHL